MNTQRSLVLLSSLFFSFSTMAASKWVGEWFDVEVIVLSQLDDKNKLKEVFSDDLVQLNFDGALDLLTPYINPNISQLKQKILLCGEAEDNQSYLERATIWPIFHQEKTIIEIIQTQDDSFIENTTEVFDNNNSEMSDTADYPVDNLLDDQLTEQSGNDDFFDRVKTAQEVDGDNIVPVQTIQPTSEENSLPVISLDERYDEIALTEEQVQLVKEA